MIQPRPVERQLANAAKIAFAQGKVELCQKISGIVGEGKKAVRVFDYIAQKRRHYKVPLVSGELWQPKIIKTWLGANV